MEESIKTEESITKDVAHEPNKSIVELQDVFKIFHQGKSKVMALRGITLTLAEGEIVVIMGPSGSGKTTLLHAIAGLVTPDSGEVIFDGQNISHIPEKDHQQYLLHKIGIIFQFFNLIPTLTAAGNIELPLLLANVKNPDRKDRITALLQMVNMQDRAHHHPSTLSGGEKQRIAIAQALANQPHVILADEPTGNVDSNAAEEIMAIFTNIVQKNPHCMIIIVTHNPAFKSIADRVLILKDGVLYEQNPEQ